MSLKTVQSFFDLFFLCRVEREIQKLRQRISEVDENSRTHSIGTDEKMAHSSSPVSHIQSLNTLIPLSDDRYATPGSTGWFHRLVLQAGYRLVLQAGSTGWIQAGYRLVPQAGSTGWFHRLVTGW